MRQFILGKNVDYATETDVTKIEEGAVGFYYHKDDETTPMTSDSDGTGITKEGMLILGRTNENGGPIVFPIFKNNFSYVKGEYDEEAANDKYFEAVVEIEAPTRIGDYSLIVVKKGLKFNERNKWTAMVHVKDVTMTADELATALAKAITNNKGSEVEAEASGATITITGKRARVDYEIIGADFLFDYTTLRFDSGDYNGKFISVKRIVPIVYGSAEYVKDLAEKAAAEAGFEYTYRDAYYYIYPNYPLNPLAQPDTEDKGYTIFTLRFAEPRDVKTRDEVVNQIIQVAFPTGASVIDKFEAVCKGLAGVSTSTSNNN